MLFPTLSVSVLGFAASVVAAPHLHSRHEVAARDPAEHVERGVTWSPVKRRDLIAFNAQASFNNVNDVTFIQDFSQFSQQNTVVITEIQQNSLQQEQLLAEQQLTQLLQEQLFVLQSQTLIVDNIRKNHFNSRNSNVNTVILICQQLTDNRSGTSNNRWFTRQIQSNPSNQQQVVVVIQDNSVLNIGGSNSNSISGSNSASAAASASNATAPPAAAPVGSYQPSAGFQGFTPNVSLLPAGVTQPQFGFGAVGVDPALIILENQPTFVSFSQQSQQVVDTQILSLQSFSSNSISGNTLII